MLRSGVILLVLGIAVFLVASVQLFRGRTKKAHWCISCVLAMLLVGNGIWNANRYFDLGIGVPKTFSAENWAKTAPAQRHFMGSDLQDSTELVGMSADEVRELLGTPDYADTDTCLSYLIAQPFDEVTLDLTLENGIVTKVEEKDH
ncbi:hypothetical protein DW088_12245 [Butyricicoccus sp. AM05-1]|uniref:hypothetical protein n=1 Tax=Butyricicoccus sp. AM05-1 TaxID=2292004 RepID=UPI000E4FD822|nr:hypothetical protein [Butyricicoccus sp. AM05-1]RHO62098.1 hypothetical protein DW088_12245 [Butyricicoccus sp. AM05-1]